MSDTKVESVVDETTEVKTLSMDDVQNLVKEQVESVKAEWMKRFDQKNTEATQLKKKLDEIERAKLSEQERVALEKSDLENALKEKEKALTEKEINFNKSILIAEMKLDREYLDIVNGNDVDVFKKNIEVINKKINDEVEKRVNERLGTSLKPTGNTNNEVSIQDEIEKLTKEGKLAEAIALQNKLYNMQMK